MRFPVMAVGACTLLVLAGCGAGSPQNEDVRDAQSLALSKVTTASDEARQEFMDGVRESDYERYPEAIEHFKRAVALDSTFALALMYEARAISYAVSTDQGRQLAARAVQLGVHASEIERAEIEAEARFQNNDFDGALASAQKLVQLDPQGARSWWFLSGVHYAMEERTKSREAGARAMALAPQIAMFYSLQSGDYATNEPRDLRKAEEYARKGVELSPNEASQHDHLGDALRAQGKLEEAAAEYTRMAELDPTQGDGYQQRAHVNAFLGRYAEARADYDAAAATSSQPLRRFQLVSYRALVPLLEGNPHRAFDELEALIKEVEASDIPAKTDLVEFLATTQGTIASLGGMVAETEHAVKRINANFQQRIAAATSDDVRRQNRANIAFWSGIAANVRGDNAATRRAAAEYRQIRAPEQGATKDRGAHLLLGLAAYGEKNYAEAERELDAAGPDTQAALYYRAKALDLLGRTADAREIWQRLATNYFFTPLIGFARKEALAKTQGAS